MRGFAARCGPVWRFTSGRLWDARPWWAREFIEWAGVVKPSLFGGVGNDKAPLPPGDSVYDAVPPSEDVAVSLLCFPPTDPGGSMECIGAGTATLRAPAMHR